MAKNVDESDSTHSSEDSCPISSKWIKVTPKELLQELVREPLAEIRKSINQLKEEKDLRLWNAIWEMCPQAQQEQAEQFRTQQQLLLDEEQFDPEREISATGKSKGKSKEITEITLFRVHGKDGTPDLESEAEKQQRQLSLTEQQKKSLVAAHAEKNVKIQSELHSPFVSTTSDISRLIRNTFADHTSLDPNLRNEVFEGASFVSTFSNVPTVRCTNVTQGPGVGEFEVLYDTSYGSLATHQETRKDNPFVGSVQVDFSKISRQRNNYAQASVKTINAQYDGIPKTVPITRDITRQYNEWYEAQTKLYSDIMSQPKQRGMSSATITAQATPSNILLQSQQALTRPVKRKLASRKSVRFISDDQGQSASSIVDQSHEQLAVPAQQFLSQAQQQTGQAEEQQIIEQFLSQDEEHKTIEQFLSQAQEKSLIAQAQDSAENIRQFLSNTQPKSLQKREDELTSEARLSVAFSSLDVAARFRKCSGLISSTHFGSN